MPCFVTTFPASHIKPSHSSFLVQYIKLSGQWLVKRQKVILTIKNIFTYILFWTQKLWELEPRLKCIRGSVCCTNTHVITKVFALASVSHLSFLFSRLCICHVLLKSLNFPHLSTLQSYANLALASATSLRLEAPFSSFLWIKYN